MTIERSSAPSGGPLPRGNQHIGVTVPGLDAATRFLADGLGVKVAYDGLSPEDEPRSGPEVERQFGLRAGAEIRRHEDTPGNGSVYVRAPWGMLIELQTIPGGHTYPADAEAEVWMPRPR